MKMPPVLQFLIFMAGLMERVTAVSGAHHGRSAVFVGLAAAAGTFIWLLPFHLAWKRQQPPRWVLDSMEEWDKEATLRPPPGGR